MYRRRDGRWEGALTLPGTGGRRRRFYGASEEQVARQLEALAAAAAGEAVVPASPTVGDYLAWWLEVVIRPARRPNTSRAYESLVRLRLCPALGHLPLAGLTPQQVQAALLQTAAGPLAGTPCAVQRMRDVLRGALQYALRCGAVARNAAALAAPPRYARPEVRPFTPEEARAFLAASRGERLAALYAVALALGLRQGEALGLTRGGVDLAAGTLHVRQQLQRVDRRLRRCDLKTAQSRRACASRPPCSRCSAHTESGSGRSGTWRARAGTSPSPTSSLRRRSARRCSRAPWRSRSTRSSRGPACGGSASTTRGTAARRCCWCRGSRRG